MNSNKKIAVAMSGGVDSSVAAILLKKQGYEVVGITGVMQKDQDVSQKALEICNSIGIEHHSIDLTERFTQEVIKYFEETYKRGETPNPCVLCNKKIKWGIMFNYAIKELGANYYATGHYAKLVDKDGNFTLYRAKDEKKDQLYMLFELSQQYLSKTLFPIGELLKNEVREIAKEYNIPCKNSKESQDICFIPPPDSAKKYLLRTFSAKRGKFINIETKEVMGEHNGYFQFTIGQRKGIGIAYNEPLYVIKLDAKTNTVFVGTKDKLMKKNLVVESINWQQEDFSKKEFEAMVKIRYNTTAKPAIIIPSNGGAKITFKKEVTSVTPGQAAVIYDKNNEFLIGGGWIK